MAKVNQFSDELDVLYSKGIICGLKEYNSSQEVEYFF